MLHDLHRALRSLLKTPGFAIVALATIALGIGVNASMFSVLNALLFREPAYAEPARVLRVFRDTTALTSAPQSPAGFLDMQANLRSFRHLAGYSTTGHSLARPGESAQQLPGLAVTGDFFAALGTQPLLGRSITAEDDQPGSDSVVVLSHALWNRLYAADPAVIGREIRLDGRNVTVIGVMPASFSDPLVWGQVDLWRPMAFNDATRADRASHWLNVLGRLQPGVTPEQAQAEAAAFFAQLARDHPRTNANTTVRLVPFARSMQDGAVRSVSLFASALAGCVLLIACANLANLLFARNALRAREQAVRAALGASRLRLIRESLAVSLLLALAGGALGLLAATWGNSALAALLQMDGLALSLDWRVLGFAFALTLASGAIFGLLPAWSASCVDLNETLKQGGRGSSGGTHRLRRALVVAQVALALVLLSGAGFFLRGLQGVLQRDQGWRPENLLTGNIQFPSASFDAKQLPGFYERIESRLATLPGVTHVALARTMPLTGFNWNQRFIIDGRPAPERGAEPSRRVNGVTPGYFRALGIELLEGRAFSPADAEGPARTIIGESMARALWPGESALGKRITHPNTPGEWQEIVGVVRDVAFPANLMDNQPGFQTYRLLAREPAQRVVMLLRCTGAPDTLGRAVRAALAEIAPDAALESLAPAPALIQSGLSRYHAVSWLLAGFAGLGLLLAALGIYGVISGFVAQRTNEIGIRVALGAQLRDVIRLVLVQGLRLAALGALLGLAASWWVGSALRAMLPALPPAGLSTAIFITLALLAVSLFASWLPARRATRVNPLDALRAE